MKRLLLLAALTTPGFVLAAVTADAAPQAAAPAPASAPAPAPAAAAAEAVPAVGARSHEAHPELAGLPAQALAVRVEPAGATSPLAVGVWPGAPYQGALLVVDVAAPAAITDATGTFLGKKLIWHRLDERTWRGMGPVPDDAKVGGASLAVEVKAGGAKLKRTIDLEVRPLEFDADELRVDPKFTKLSKKAAAQVAKDREAIAAMWRKGSAPAPHFSANFVVPRADRTTAPYGTRRVYNGKTRSVHHGWDIDGDVGDEIRAPNAGVVTLASDLYYSGGTLFVDHGGGLYTGYFHMDSFAVKPGQRVEAGELIGTVGKSGRVTGPHLHWAAKVGGHYIHPASVLLFDFTRPMVGGAAAAGPPSEGPKVVPAGATR